MFSRYLSCRACQSDRLPANHCVARSDTNNREVPINAFQTIVPNPYKAPQARVIANA